MTSSQIGIMISIVVYLAVVVIIGLVYSKKTKNVGDFYLGGRKLGPLVTAMSARRRICRAGSLWDFRALRTLRVLPKSAEASLKSAQASVELIQAQLAKTEVRAPFSGKLGFVDVSVGAWLNSGTPIAELSEVDRLKAKFSLPQRYASVIKVGDKISLKDSERNVEKFGVVSALDAVISESSRTRRVMVDVDNAKGELIAGSFVSVNVAMEASNVQSFTIPSEAMILDREGAYVFVSQGGKAKIKHITTGLRTPMSVQVLSGLDVGDTVIVSGIVSLRPGADVKIKGLRHSINYEVE